MIEGLAVVGDVPEPPAELTPDTFAARLYAMLQPVAQFDPENTWSLLTYCNSVGIMFQLVEDLVRDSPDGEPGWSLLLDLSRCPDAGLPWLGQFVGVRIPPGATDDQARALIAGTANFKRGTRAAIVAAVQATLTGSKTVFLRERTGNPAISPEYAYYLDVTTYTTQTPDSAATLRAILSQKPGALVLNYAVHDGQSWQQVKDTGQTWTQVKSGYPTWDAVRKATPTRASRRGKRSD